MRYVKWMAILVVLIGVMAAAWTAAWASEQEWTRGRRLEVLSQRKGGIGVSVRDVTPDDVKRSALESEMGVVVEDVRPDSPAVKAGFEKGDVVTQFDGERVRSTVQFSRLVRETPEGRAIPATIVRGTERMTLEVAPERGDGTFAMLERLPEHFDTEEFRRSFRFDIPPLPDFDVQVHSRPGRLCVSVSDLEPQLADYFGVKRGVLVTSVRQESAAAAAGVRAGDVITQVNGRAIDDTGDVRREIDGVADGTAATLTVVRDRKELLLEVTIQGTEGRAASRPRAVI